MKIRIFISEKIAKKLESKENIQQGEYNLQHLPDPNIRLFSVKKIFLFAISICISFMLNAQVSKAVSTNAGGLYSALTQTELNTITNLTVIGTIDFRDFVTMRDYMPSLTEVDLKGTSIAAYTSINPMDPGYYPGNTIPDYALSFKGLSSVILPSSLTAIGEGAFGRCGSLNSINIPASVNSIGNMAFFGCSGLTSIYVYGMTPVILSSSLSVFDGVDLTVCSLIIPFGSYGMYASANQWQDFKNISEMSGFHLSATTINIGATQGSTTSLNITSNIGWIASSDQTWLSVSPSNGTGVQTLTFTADANPSNTTQRNAIVTISATGISSQTITVTQFASVLNRKPTANTGMDQNVNEGSIVTLDGNLSSDPDGDQLTYKWTSPAGITLSSTTDTKPTFTAPEVSADTEYSFSLIVNDGLLNSTSDEVKIIVKQVNKAPIANAGPDQSVSQRILVTLDGTLSHDVDGDALSYYWTAPAGIKLNNNSVVRPTFYAPNVRANTSFIFSLVVNDGKLSSQPNEMIVRVINGNEPPDVICHDFSVTLNANGDYTLSKKDLVNIVAGTTDDKTNFNKLIINVQPNSFSCSNIEAPVLATITVTDAEGATSTCQSKITVSDKTNPVFAKGAKHIRVTINEGQEYILPDVSTIYPATDNCDKITYVQFPEPGTIYKSETLENIVLKATDFAGNTSEANIKLSVSVRKAKMKSATVDIANVNEESSPLKVYPNPFSNRVFFEIFSPEDSKISLELFNATGSKLKNIYEGQIHSDELLKFEFVPDNIASQLLIYKLTMNNEVHYGKVIYRK